MEPPKNRTGCTVQWFNYAENALILDEEKAIKKIYFDPIKSLNLLQESSFIYDCSSLVKPYFISELYQSIAQWVTFPKKEEKKSKIILTTNQKIFFYRKLDIKKWVRVPNTAQKMNFSIKDFFSRCNQICSFLQIWSYLLKKSLMEKWIFCAMK